MPIKFDPKSMDNLYALDKETIAQTWFFVGSELRRMKRTFASHKLFGQHVASSEYASIKNHDRSMAIWMFEHWWEVLDWLQDEIGRTPTDPFWELAKLNASHPAHIKRRVVRWRVRHQASRL